MIEKIEKRELNIPQLCSKLCSPRDSCSAVNSSLLLQSGAWPIINHYFFLLSGGAKKGHYRRKGTPMKKMIHMTILSMAILLACSHALLAADTGFKDGIEGLKIMFGGGGKTAWDKGITADLKYQAKAVSHGEPGPVWQTPVFMAEVGEVVPLAAGRVLVGLLDLAQNFAMPVNGPYVLLDSKDGRIIWTYKRSKKASNQYGFLFEGSTLVVTRITKKSVRYIGLEEGTGKELWKKEFKLPQRAAIDPKSETLVVAQSKKGSIQLTALNIHDGSTIWKVKESGGKDDPVPGLLVGDGHITMVGSKAARFTVGSGQKLWQVDGIGPVAEGSLSILTSDGVIVPAEDGTVRKIGVDGKVAWVSNLDLNLMEITLSQDILYIQARSLDEDSDHLVAMKVADGTKVWHVRFKGRFKSRLALSGSLLAFTDDNDQLSAVTIKTGKLIFRIAMPEGKSLLPDNLVLYNDHVVVGRERKVAAWSLKDGRNLWAFDVDPGSDYYEYGMITSMIRSGLNEGGKKTAAAAASYQFPHEDQPQSFDRNFMANQKMVLRDPNSSHLDRELAASNMYVGAQMNAASSRIDATLDFWAASWKLQESAGAWIKAKAEGAENSRLTASLSITPRYHLEAVKGDYYVRPFEIYQDRYGLMIIDMRNGKWTEITTGPYDLIYVMWALQTQLATITEGNRLLVRGTGLDPEMWQAYVRWNRTLPSPAILAYDLDKMSFHGPSEFKTAGLRPKSQDLLKKGEYYISKGDEVISLVDVKTTPPGAPFGAEKTVLIPKGTKWLATTDQSRITEGGINVSTGEIEYFLTVLSVRKAGAPWPPNFQKGQKVMLAIKDGIRDESGRKVVYYTAPNRGDVLTVTGASDDGYYVLAADQEGKLWQLPFSVVVLMK